MPLERARRVEGARRLALPDFALSASGDSQAQNPSQQPLAAGRAPAPSYGGAMNCTPKR